MKKRQKKKLSRRKAQKQHIRLLEAELAVRTSEAATYKDRLFALGLDENLEYIPGLNTPNCKAEIELKPIHYGNYMAACDELPIDQIKYAKEQLVGSIVRGLIENGLVRFIYRKGNDYDTLHRFSTLAARIDVLPWERLTTRAVMYKSYREIKEEKADGDIEKAGVE